MLTVLLLPPLKFGTLSLNPSILVPVLIPSVITIASRPSNQLNTFLLVPQIHLLTITHLYKLHLLTYLLLIFVCSDEDEQLNTTKPRSTGTRRVDVKSKFHMLHKESVMTLSFEGVRPGHLH